MALKVISKQSSKAEKPESLKDLIQATKPDQNKKDGDLIRVWENYLEKAYFWRALFFLQIPITIFALALASVIFINRNITLNVPPVPKPGIYSPESIPDVEFINFATNFVNLIFNVNPANIERHFETAKTFLAPQPQEAFSNIFFKQEVPIIKTTGASQVFIIDPLKTVVKRRGSTVQVTFTGERIRFLAGKETRYSFAFTEVTLRTVPHTNLNPYGIAVINFTDLKDVES